MTTPVNPYEPTAATELVPGTLPRRSPVVTFLASVLGLTALGLAVLVLLETASVAKRQDFKLNIDTATGLGVGLVFGLFAAIWFLAAYFSMRRKRGTAVVMTWISFVGVVLLLVVLTV
ncbi:hypothetical protein [Planctomycetes bacterium K23_9]|uniref:Uncharacterized protein n=1 Tax=Stieleria marina TaxID=1930275 RepID=A0A517NW33_9BACT|nr:hypothetical protein K239x_33290 [Planctomycetes bacterium K23_9]